MNKCVTLATRRKKNHFSSTSSPWGTFYSILTVNVFSKPKFSSVQLGISTAL